VHRDGLHACVEHLLSTDYLKYGVKLNSCSSVNYFVFVYLDKYKCSQMFSFSILSGQVIVLKMFGYIIKKPESYFS